MATLSETISGALSNGVSGAVDLADSLLSQMAGSYLVREDSLTTLLAIAGPVWLWDPLVRLGSVLSK